MIRHLESMDRRSFLKTAAIGSALAAGVLAGLPYEARGAAPFSLPPLPYPENGLEPHISARTIGFHYGKHHKGYLDRTNEMAPSAGMEKLSLEDLIRSAKKAGNQPLFNNAAQVFNHTFYWNSMKPGGGGEVPGKLKESIVAAFGSVDGFKERFAGAAETQFGSGYAWLIQEGASLKVLSMPNAETPIALGMKPLLTIDVWEHAYYLDHQNNRKGYVRAFLDHLVNWDFVAQNLGRA